VRGREEAMVKEMKKEEERGREMKKQEGI